MAGEDAVIADRDPVGISAQVLKDSFGAGEGILAIDYPLFIIETFQENREVILKMADAGKDENTFLEAIFEEVKELAPEQCRHDFYGKKKSLPA